ncbi:MAG: HutD/Ves family protein [Phyllobacterium sp.]
MRIVRASNHRAMPWKNGGGVTTQIAIWPPEATAADFDWRVSMATVAADGPFSNFAGIDRTLAILDGAGIDLDVAEHGAVRLTQDTAPFAFPGDVPTAARLVAGPATDLNVMTRRGRWTHAAERLSIGAEQSRALNTDLTLALCCRGTARVDTADGTVLLATHDMLVIEASDALLEISLTGPAELLVVQLAQQTV